MGELYNPYPRLPKNIRQVGERDQILKLYVEDYVNTYLKRLYPAGGQDLRVGLLLGEMRNQDGMNYILVDGAMEMEEVSQGDGKLLFHEDIWQKAYQTIEQMFPARVVVGWFLCGSADNNLSPLNYWKQHSQYFSGKHQLMYLNNGLDGEEAIYIASDDGFYKLRGHCIYYERNQMMQDYMVCRKDVKRVESGNHDGVIQDFRQRMDDKKQQIKKRHSTVSVLGTACGMLTVLVLASGVVTFNNFQKMKEMESVIASAVPEGSAREWALSLTRGEETADSGEMEFEEVSGDVYPTKAEIVIETESPTESPTTAPAHTETLPVVQEQPETEAAVPVQVPANAVTYVVQDGETLYGICIDKYQSLKNLETICAWNQLEDENRISAGQQLFLPPME